MARILIVEDEKELATIMVSYLKVEGFDAVAAFDGQKGKELFEKEEFDLVLLDIMLPLINGMELCRMIREKSNIPIIMISAKSGEMDKVIALGNGADDYVTKPFSPLELVARVKAQLRRANVLNASEEKDKNEISSTWGELTLCQDSYTAMVGKETVEFTTKEFQILYYLAQNQGIVFTKAQIYESVWKSDFVDENAVVVYINRIRDKLKKYSIDYIKTVWGVGYKFVCNR